VFESGSILLYLADKPGRLAPADPVRRYETIQWVFFQMAAIGPMFGQLGFFHKFAGREIEDKRPLERYAGESKRLLGVLEGVELAVMIEPVSRRIAPKCQNILDARGGVTIEDR